MDMSSEGKSQVVGPDRTVSKSLMDPDAGSTPAGRPDRSCAGSPWWRLAGQAEERRTVHEADPPDRRTAARAGLPPAALALQGTVEVAALAVDVDVEGVEGGAALAERRGHHRAGRV